MRIVCCHVVLHFRPRSPLSMFNITSSSTLVTTVTLPAGHVSAKAGAGEAAWVAEQAVASIQWFLNNNIWHLHSLSIDESHGNGWEIPVSLRYTLTWTSCEKCNSKAFRLGIEPASSGLLDQCSTTELQSPLPTTWARHCHLIKREV